MANSTTEAQAQVTCPECQRVMTFDTVLHCSTCDLSFDKTKAGFYDLRQQTVQQQKGLQSGMEDEFYGSDVYRKLVAMKNNNVIREALSHCRRDVVLDVGCGNGIISDLLYDEFETYIGLDPSTIDVAHSRKNPSNGVWLIHNHPARAMPVADESIDTVMMLASYDHLPQPEGVVQECWRKLKPGGHMLINMTNYGFWLKTLINRITGKQLFKNEHEHFCVHSPKTMFDELSLFVEGAELVFDSSDYIYIPNLPRRLGWLYSSKRWTEFLNALTKAMFHGGLGLKSCGSLMTLVIRKKT